MAFVNFAAVFALCVQYQSINCFVSTLCAAVASACEQMLMPHQCGHDFSQENSPSFFPLVTKWGLLALLELATILDPFGHPGAAEILSGSLINKHAFFQIPEAVSL
jgi:hypothetical protein